MLTYIILIKIRNNINLMDINIYYFKLILLEIFLESIKHQVK